MNKTTLIQIAKYGQYYCPAHKHYNKIVSVECDRCGLKPLKACIGYGDKDLCLTCANKLIESGEPQIVYDDDFIIKKPFEAQREMCSPLKGCDFFNFNDVSHMKNNEKTKSVKPEFLNIRYGIENLQNKVIIGPSQKLG